jgi:ethanolamine utilization protein EutQ (cupin superfamily)
MELRRKVDFEKLPREIPIEGRLEIEYENGKVSCVPGDGIYIPNGPAHKRRDRVLSENTKFFFVETA